AQKYPAGAFEIIVVDDGSVDETKAVVEKAIAASPEHQIKYVYREHGGLSASRNDAIHAARSDLICFIDDDAVASPDCVREIVAGTGRYPDIDCFVGRIYLRLEGPAPRTCGQEFQAWYLDAGDEERP